MRFRRYRDEAGRRFRVGDLVRVSLSGHTAIDKHSVQDGEEGMITHVQTWAHWPFRVVAEATPRRHDWYAAQDLVLLRGPYARRGEERACVPGGGRPQGLKKA